MGNGVGQAERIKWWMNRRFFGFLEAVEFPTVDPRCRGQPLAGPHRPTWARMSSW